MKLNLVILRINIFMMDMDNFNLLILKINKLKKNINTSQLQLKILELLHFFKYLFFKKLIESIALTDDNTFVSLIYLNENIEEIPFLDEYLWFQ